MAEGTEKMDPELVLRSEMEQQREIHESRRQEHRNFEAEIIEGKHGAARLRGVEGHATILELLLETDDSRGKNVIRSLLFMACSQGHAVVVKVLLNHNNLHTSDEDDDEDSLDPVCSFEAVSRGHKGYLPVHLVAINGKTSIFIVFMDLAPLSFVEHTKLQGQTIVHLTIQYDQFDAFLSLVNFFRHTQIFPSVDQDGNSPLRVSVLRGRHKVT
ncbi:unnamed protein product [Citrullus colocynthis]|uniref:Uncharacterized protein n=1 Tax=Citrullus colocynthis TaxID=252529 RepID=A0ABP0YVT0_9ROSI